MNPFIEQALLIKDELITDELFTKTLKSELFFQKQKHLLWIN